MDYVQPYSCGSRRSGLSITQSLFNDSCIMSTSFDAEWTHPLMGQILQVLYPCSWGICEPRDHQGPFTRLNNFEKLPSLVKSFIGKVDVTIYTCQMINWNTFVHPYKTTHSFQKFMNICSISVSETEVYVEEESGICRQSMLCIGKWLFCCVFIHTSYTPILLSMVF